MYVDVTRGKIKVYTDEEVIVLDPKSDEDAVRFNRLAYDAGGFQHSSSLDFPEEFGSTRETIKSFLEKAGIEK